MTREIIIIISLPLHRIAVNLNTYEDRMSGAANVKGQTLLPNIVSLGANCTEMKGANSLYLLLGWKV